MVGVYQLPIPMELGAVRHAGIGDNSRHEQSSKLAIGNRPHGFE